MQEKHLFEYALIHVVPRVERMEFLNVGIILYCPGQRFLETLFKVDAERLKTFSGELDTGELDEYLHSFRRICRGEAGSGPIGKLPAAERFRWLTAARSTVVQTSKVHPGLCEDARETLLRLYRELVL